MWAAFGAVALVATGALEPKDALSALGAGGDVYLFLFGMMVLAEIARRAGLFEWLAGHAVARADGSSQRLLALVYGVGVAVTVFLSNDATAIVLTPAVAAAVARAKAVPLPYLYACAFVANAASFVLPISNPANLVVFSSATPPLVRWLAAFALPSLVAIGVTYGLLALGSRTTLRARLECVEAPAPLGRNGRLAFCGVGLASLALAVASTLGWPIGLATCVAAAVVLIVVAMLDRGAVPEVLRGISWSVLALVAGLFVLVRGLDASGAVFALRPAIADLARWPYAVAAPVTAFAVATISNLINNLPSGLVAATLLDHAHANLALRSVTTIGIDLGPNLSVTGSLATLLWLAALRREGIEVSAATFLRVGCVVMPPALLLAVASLAITIR
jgi:arsenical pump membrane protein